MTAAPIMLWTGGWRDTGGCEWKKMDYSVESSNGILFSFPLEQLYMVMSSSLNSMAPNPFSNFLLLKTVFVSETTPSKKKDLHLDSFKLHTVGWICRFQVELLLLSWTNISDFCWYGFDSYLWQEIFKNYEGITRPCPSVTLRNISKLPMWVFTC